MRSGRPAAARAWVNGVSSRSAAIEHVAPQEPQAPVAQQRTGHETGLGDDLEAVADAEDEPTVGRERRRPRA